ncbi:tRNA (adenosine(37)-N6)-dimethylallyltransferase MiaA [Gramella sp. AN32]|uniref:tRNA dimethylallyltransferase n=1 Tax=Christiangramia antarctica TaxID=2058158 RepID=A0ABW5X5Y7_9FLAO|nr:tRNA (adenosine(37)-N6)-dimethylallyltransferase MiaA [Gramella sp. AN32]MCM4157784.1 tRNA (adenosine(37)-N6)-dimethylallyltransferase MiaA [Gramella sp. AN32]
MNKYLINIVGPTAIGKTSLAIQIAEHFRTEIISSDSRQFYKEMKIGTAVPDPEELAAVKHHFIQHISIEEAFNVGDFEKAVLQRLESLFAFHNTVVMVGGSGLYAKAVIEGLDDFPEVDPEIRQKLNRHLEDDGIDWLQKQLYMLDPNYYKIADVQNPHRLIRALEICMGTGKTFSSFLKNKQANRNFKTISIGLTAPRELIYNRINERVDLMLKNGLLHEVEKLQDKRHYNALNTVGYKELFQHLAGAIDLPTAVEEIKKNTRRFAKRQLTWYRKDESINWFNFDENPQNILTFISEKINS